MANRDDMMKRQRILANFGEFALRSDELHEVLTEACRLISEALDTPLAKVLKIENGNGTAVVTAGVGWPEGVVGKAEVQLSDRSSEAHAIEQGEPLITQNINEEERFEFPDFMKEAGVMAFVNVPIFPREGEPFGILQVDDKRPRDFDEDDIQFLRTYASILEAVIDRVRRTQSLQESLDRNQELMSELQHRVKNNIATVASLIRLRQRATGSDEVRAELSLIGNRVDTMRLVHQRLGERGNIDRIELGAYLRDLLENLVHMQDDTEHEVACEIETEEVEIAVEKATPIGLIVNEFVTNSFKYAFREKGGTITLELECDADHVVLTLTDDGPGLERDPDEADSSPGSGIKLIEALARQLDAEPDWTCTAEGVCLRLKIPRCGSTAATGQN